MKKIMFKKFFISAFIICALMSCSREKSETENSPALSSVEVKTSQQSTEFSSIIEDFKTLPSYNLALMGTREGADQDEKIEIFTNKIKHFKKIEKVQCVVWSKMNNIISCAYPDMNTFPTLSFIFTQNNLNPLYVGDVLSNLTVEKVHIYSLGYVINFDANAIPTGYVVTPVSK
jgi:hypothetical protein